MPIPAVVGAGFIAGIVTKLFSLVFDLMSKVVVRRYAFFAAAVATLLILIGSMYAAINGLLAAIDMTVGAEYLGAVRVLLPSSIDEMVSIAVGIRIIETIFVFNAKLVLQKALI